MRLGVRAGATLALTAMVVGAACGKRGAPIPPNVRIPAAVATIGATRLGNDIYVTLTVPSTNIDESMPIDIQRIDVYGYTGRNAPPTARFVELGGVVASIPVVAPPKVDEDVPPPPAPDPEPRPARLDEHRTRIGSRAHHCSPAENEGLVCGVRDGQPLDVA